MKPVSFTLLRIGLHLVTTFLFTLGFGSPGPVHAQKTVDSFYSVGAEWTYHYREVYKLCSSCSHDATGAMAFIVMKDTVIDGDAYKLLYQKMKGKYGWAVVPGSGYSVKEGPSGPWLLGYLMIRSDSIFFTNKTFTDYQTAFHAMYPLDVPAFLYVFDSTKWTTASAEKLFTFLPMRFVHSMFFACYDNQMGFTFKDLTNPIKIPSNLNTTCFDWNVYLNADEIGDVNHQLSIFPNPLPGNTLSFSGVDPADLASIRVCDFQGKEVRAYYPPAFQSGNVSIDLPPSVYVVRFEFKDGRSKMQMLSRL